jgi:hypothetical protein
MTSQAIQAVLRKITDSDNKMSRATIKGELESCLSSLRETTKMQISLQVRGSHLCLTNWCRHKSQLKALLGSSIKGTTLAW